MNPNSIKKNLDTLKKIVPEPLKATVVKTAGPLLRTPKSPDDSLGEIFQAIQKQRLFTDGKTFVDLVPKRRPALIREAYQIESQSLGFNLHDFVGRHFYEARRSSTNHETDASLTPAEHISKLWDWLRMTNRRNRGSLLALPHPYIVPGGRFKEQFYWDTYFIMLGLATDGKWRSIEDMMKNYAYMLRKFGRIPTANRSYFLSRSQPPFFSHMVELLASHKGPLCRIEYLPYLVAEQKFWMKGYGRVLPSGNSALRRVVCLPDGTLLNRYYDDKATPRPESYDEDTTTASGSESEQAARLFLDLRAGAESGWDFSSRWFDNPNDLRTIRTTDIIPVDLNCLLYHLESTIAKGYAQLKQTRLSAWYAKIAEERADAIRHWCWDEQEQFFSDFDLRSGTVTGRLTLAAVFPLFAGIATKEQAELVARRIENDFLKAGGLLTTLVDNGQQWDAPNGWAPLQYAAVTGLKQYGYTDLAETIKANWVHSNLEVFKNYHKFIEKYDVVTPGKLGGGGEYPLQDGFGWTNGVFSAFTRQSAKNPWK